MYFIDINITQHVFQSELENGKANVILLFYIVFIELNFTVAFLLLRKTWDDRFAGKVGGGGMGDLNKQGGGSQKWGDDFEMEGWDPFMDHDFFSM